MSEDIQFTKGRLSHTTGDSEGVSEVRLKGVKVFSPHLPGTLKGCQWPVHVRSVLSKEDQ